MDSCFCALAFSLSSTLVDFHREDLAPSRRVRTVPAAPLRSLRLRSETIPTEPHTHTPTSPARAAPSTSNSLSNPPHSTNTATAQPTSRKSHTHAHIRACSRRSSNRESAHHITHTSSQPAAHSRLVSAHPAPDRPKRRCRLPCSRTPCRPELHRCSVAPRRLRPREH